VGCTLWLTPPLPVHPPSFVTSRQLGAEEPKVKSSWGPYTSFVGTAKTTAVPGASAKK